MIVDTATGGSKTCAACGKDTPAYDTVISGSMETGYRVRCTRCFNADIANLMGLDHFEHVDLKPISMTDRAGESHEFHFQTRLLGDILALEAFELKDDMSGYRFELLGKPEDDVLVLLGRMIERIRKGLSVQYITQDGNGPRIAETKVSGRIEWDDTEFDRTPLLIIDGKTVSWAEFGDLLMQFEGWQFRLEIRDRSEEA